ncbi:MAG: HAD family phosphatase, partial [Pyramidobacter sp.]|nr:HAD family phosphatase [Pyramidobacter sp.]
MDFDAALFDLDGTLIDSKGVWARIDAEFLQKRGIVPPDDYMKEVSSKKFSEAAVYTIERFGLSDTVEGLSAEWLEMARTEYGTNIFLKEGAAEFLKELKKRGLRLGTVSGLPHALSDAVLEHNGVRGLFDAFTSADDAVRGKEFPDVYLLAASRLGAAPERCLVFEDVTACALSAREAGMTVCAVWDGQTQLEWEALTCAAHVSARSFAEFRETGCFDTAKL